MIPVVFTKKHFFEIRTQTGDHNMNPSTLLYSADNQLFSVRKVGHCGDAPRTQ